jgi:phage terminase large subunit GpA-like protein
VRWRTDRVPYLREIMRLSDHRPDRVPYLPSSKVVVVAASQTAKTELLLTRSGFTFINILRRSCASSLASRTARPLEGPHRADAARQPGPEGQGQGRALARQWEHARPQELRWRAHLTLAGANSAAGLSMRPIRVVLLDEVSRYPASAGTEGDPVALAVKRTTTFWDRKIVMVSSPALEGSCRITAAYEETDRREYHLACPHCDERQVLDWSRVEWEKDETSRRAGTARRRRPTTASSAAPPGRTPSAGPPCPAASGSRRIPSRKNRPGFRISQLYSPWKRMGELAAEYLESRGNMEREKAFQNTALGLPYRVSGVTADAERLYERREGYRRGEVPDRALVLTAGVDVHPDRLECEVVGWGRGLESWSVDYVVLQGDPTRAEVWAEFDEHVRNAVWERPDGSLAKLSRIAVDSGDNTAASTPGGGAWPTRG